MDDLVALPSGRILNLALVVWFAPVNGALVATFAAGSAADPLELTFDAGDAAALLDAFGRRSINVSATRKLVDAAVTK